MSVLFSPYSLKDITLRNRIAVAPMCQYAANEGFTTEWHHGHYPSLASGGAGLVIVEATAVSPEGRITPDCLGIWNDAQVEGMAKIAASIKASGAVAGLQIGHAGRKGNTNRPWEGDNHFPADDPRTWTLIAPSAIAFGDILPRVPQAMTLADIDRVKRDFARAAQRAYAAGYQWLELHFAHGFLGQSFFSAYANQRTDRYGGSLQNRMRFLVETLAEVRRVWPENLPLTARFGAIEFDGRDEATLLESVELARALRSEGLDLLDVSVGFSSTNTKIPPGEALLLPIAERIRREAQIPVAAAWGMDDPHVGERAVEQQQLDVVMLAHAFLANPHYPFEAARVLGVDHNPMMPANYAHWLTRYRRKSERKLA
ncbi:NADH:flavin oxidoreductase/NADH oxidase [Pseudomonas syringae]|uniref:NADH:flavin oxidoreductase/NADH oxidase n=1 Tax=Pseudomonas syringae TaxID=317 RepID=UPI00215AE4B7|nr:NADH:flavin oxidoreductase/NADH oxidase [Pseudomonas syringae]MCR8720852.1 NADH:flavin oxidoreductase/NADH oxidase [Pseudomonas syringae]